MCAAPNAAAAACPPPPPTAWHSRPAAICRRAYPANCCFPARPISSLSASLAISKAHLQPIFRIQNIYVSTYTTQCMYLSFFMEFIFFQIFDFGQPLFCLNLAHWIKQPIPRLRILNFPDFFLKTKEPFIYYVSTCRGGGGSENAYICLFSVLKTCLRREGGGPKIPKMCLRNI